ncbi:hypothetical protein [Sphingomonas colocasiae]|uniref:DUF2336 domain-containing protein n=1 Tax=Sphingomonas colocasiae TaxID=1848973 RepID=A0ABS7PYZ0_9SPHN|nr:hypothetical protein [Sphingomonas colocasiae]MBY8825557.1 hypothetical protein [Sphingomonas colocasiae]
MVDNADPALAVMLRRFSELRPADRDLVMDLLGTPARDELQALLAKSAGEPASPALRELIASCHSRIPSPLLTPRAVEALSAAARMGTPRFSAEEAIDGAAAISARSKPGVRGPGL